MPTPASEDSDYIPIEMQSDWQDNDKVESKEEKLASILDDLCVGEEKDSVSLGYPNIDHCDGAAREIVEIDPNADVALRVESKDLLVSSKILSMASTVFDRMMSNDGTERSDPNALLILRLQDDDHEALTLLCRLLHHKFDGVSEALPSLHILLDFISLAKKYEFLPSVQFQASHWLHRKAGSLGRLSLEDKKKIYSAACLLGNEEDFRSISMETINSLKAEELEGLLLDLDPSAKPIGVCPKSYSSTHNYQAQASLHMYSMALSLYGL
ncbi:hypothetical protein Plec18170_008835 [Paecilomyces lecythidis]